MRHAIVLLVLVAAVIICSNASSGRGLGKPVTKETQKQMELDYELSAIREPGAVIVAMTIPVEGKLKDLQQVRLSILAENQKNFLIRAPLEMTEDGTSVRVSAQLDPDLAAKATLDLVVEQGRSESFYAVSISDYITDRNSDPK